MELIFAVYLTLVGTDQIIPITADSVAMTWTDPRTPSCKVFAARVQQMMADLEEIDYLLAGFNKKKGHWTRAQQLELQEALKRQARIERESKNQKLAIAAHFVLPEGSGWVTAKKYRLLVSSPGIEWAGFDGSEPRGLVIETRDHSATVHHEIHLADFCGKPRQMSLRLEQL